MSAYDHKGDWPAFPHHFTPESIGDCVGMTLRQYAAIKLRVPDSGTDWLDDMIRQSLRDEVAGKVVQGLLANHGVYEEDAEHHSLCSESEARKRESSITIDHAGEYAYAQADAMLAKAKEK